MGKLYNGSSSIKSREVCQCIHIGIIGAAHLHRTIRFIRQRLAFWSNGALKLRSFQRARFLGKPGVLITSSFCSVYAGQLVFFFFYLACDGKKSAWYGEFKTRLSYGLVFHLALLDHSRDPRMLSWKYFTRRVWSNAGHHAPSLYNRPTDPSWSWKSSSKWLAHAPLKLSPGKLESKWTWNLLKHINLCVSLLSWIQTLNRRLRPQKPVCMKNKERMFPTSKWLLVDRLQLLPFLLEELLQGPTSPSFGASDPTFLHESVQ